MSYEIVKSIKIENDEVFIKSDSNNVYPKSFKFWKSDYFTKVLQEKGRQELDIEVLKEFETGNLQSSNNSKYIRALRVLYNVYKSEYEKFNWRNFSYEDREKERALRESDEFKQLLIKALNTQLPKEKFIVKKPYYRGHNPEDNFVYVRKVTSRHIFYCYPNEKPKLFNFIEDAQRIAKQIDGSVECLNTNNKPEPIVFKRQEPDEAESQEVLL